MRERQQEREWQTDRQQEREADRHRQRDRDKESVKHDENKLAKPR